MAEEETQKLSWKHDANALSRKDAAEWLRMILNSVKDGIIALDPNGTIEGVNPAIESMFGYSQDELAGNDIGVLYEKTPTPEEVTSFLSYVRRKDGRASASKFHGRRKDGSTLLSEVAVTPMQLSDGVHYVAIVRDITERSRIEEIKDEFVATVSHELRTPLTSISGSLGLLVGGVAGQLPPKAMKLIRIAHGNSERLVRLINDILDIEKIESGKMLFNIQHVSLWALVTQSIEGLTGYADQYGVLLQLNPGFEDAAVQADPDRVMQVMANLLSNAIKFSPRGETVSVDIQLADRSYRVSISNKGEGIPEAFRDRIFSRFAQADGSSTRQRGGTGLGLNIVKEIVARLQGEVGFESSPGEGATFYFTLPAVASGGDVILICSAADPDASDGAKWTELGIKLMFARSIDELRKLLNVHAFPAVVLDLRLPDDYRTEALRVIQTAAPTPLVVLARQPGIGSSTLPLRALLDSLAGPVADTTNNGVSRTDDAAEGGRILHVEDDQDVHSLVATAFGTGTEVIAARNVKEGLEVLHQHRLDAVILDLELGSESGLKLLPTIRLLHPAVPVIIFSASDAGASEGADVEAVLTKSRVTLADLVNTVRNLIPSTGH